MTVHNNVKIGVLAVGEAAVPEGQALYWDAAGDLVTCGVLDGYRFAGFMENLDGNATSDAGDRVAVHDTEVWVAIGDGVNDYITGQEVQLGAAGIVVDYQEETELVRVVTAGEAAALDMIMPAGTGSLLTVRNDTLAIDFVISDVAAPGGGIVTFNPVNNTITFNAADLFAADNINIQYTETHKKVGKVTTGAIAPATALRVQPQ